MKRNTVETVVVDEKTGGKKGTKLARFSLIPPEPMWALAEHYGKGERKYSAKNWEKGYSWNYSLDALERHLNLFKAGEWLDNHKPDCPSDCVEHTESAHLVAVIWHAIALFVFKVRGIGTNDVHSNLSK